MKTEFTKLLNTWLKYYSYILLFMLFFAYYCTSVQIIISADYYWHNLAYLK
jgi:hypothetical protein